MLNVKIQIVCMKPALVFILNIILIIKITIECINALIFSVYYSPRPKELMGNSSDLLKVLFNLHNKGSACKNRS